MKVQNAFRKLQEIRMTTLPSKDQDKYLDPDYVLWIAKQFLFADWISNTKERCLLSGGKQERTEEKERSK